MTDEKIIKKEEVNYKQSAFSTKKGFIVLTGSRFYFAQTKGILKKHEEILFEIPIADILNAKAEKDFGYGIDNFIVLYQENGKEKKVKFQHVSFGGAIAGSVSRAGALYFGEWERLINDLKNQPSQSKSNLDDLEKLNELKQKGIITQEEFEIKKKQILGL